MILNKFLFFFGHYCFILSSKKSLKTTSHNLRHVKDKKKRVSYSFFDASWTSFGVIESIYAISLVNYDVTVGILTNRITQETYRDTLYGFLLERMNWEVKVLSSWRHSDLSNLEVLSMVLYFCFFLIRKGEKIFWNSLISCQP